MDEILESHVIFPLAIRCDDFDEFYQARETELLQRIEKAMGKPVVGTGAPLEVFLEEAEDDAS